MIERKFKRTAKISVFGVVHGVYFSQFPGLREKLEGYHRELCEKIAANDVELFDFGLLESSEDSYAAADRISGVCPDIIFCNMVTYATSSVFAPVLQAIGKTPVVLIALQPRRALDYSVASTFMQLENDNICSVPEFTGVAIRMGKPIQGVIIGTLRDDKKAEAEIAEWCDIAKVLHALHGARIGLMGHVMESMYDMHTDPTAAAAAFGLHVPLLEIDSIAELYEQVTEEEIQEKTALIKREFDMPDPGSDPVAIKLTEEDLRTAARGAAALDRFVEKYRLTGLAYYYEGLPGSLNRRVVSSFIVGNSVLNAQGFPMCGEFDLKTCIAMLIMDRLDIGGSFAEFHPFDFDGNYILVGHDGPQHLRIAEGKPVLRSLVKFHGKPGSGASVEFKIKEGPVTMLGITQSADGRFKFVVGEGVSVKGAIPPTGNTNTRAFFGSSVTDFLKKWVMEGPTHHFALGIGHRAETIQKIASCLGIECVIVK